MDEFSISITIAERTYRLVIERSQEEVFRNAVKMVDKRIKEYSNNYAYKDKQDLLAMVALEFTTGYIQNERKNIEKEDHLERELYKLDNALNEFLSVPSA